MKLEQAVDVLSVPVTGEPAALDLSCSSSGLPPSTPASSPLPKPRVLHSSTGQLRMCRVSIPEVVAS